MIVCNLSKPEATIEQVKKAYPKLKQTDAAILAVALVFSGRYAIAVYDGQEYHWPDDYNKLTQALLGQIAQIQLSVEGTTKKALKAAAEEEPVEVRIGLKANYQEAEQRLAGNESLKTLLSDTLVSGMEFQYTPTEIGWQWALDRANWATMSEGELTRRIKIKTVFEDATVGTEMGTGTKKRTTKAKPKEAAPAAEPAEEAVVEVAEAVAAEEEAAPA